MTRRLLLTIAALLLAGCARAAAEPDTAPAAGSPVAALPAPPVSVAITQPESFPTATPPPPTATPSPTATPTPTATLPPPSLANPPLPIFADEAAAYDAETRVWDAAFSGIWQYGQRSFLHPIALDVLDQTAFLIDGGRVLALNLAAPETPRQLLQGGDRVEGLVVVEPLDLAVSGPHVLVLDRAGDVYRYHPDEGVWYVDRTDRGVGDSSGHYFVALAARGDNGRYLLETNYKYAMLYRPGEARHDSLWPLLTVRAVDVAVVAGPNGNRVYTLGADMETLAGKVALYENTSLMTGFRANFPMSEVRQIQATETAVYVLDRNGRRLLEFAAGVGTLQRVWQLPQDDPVSAFWVSADGGRLLLAGRDRLYFGGDPARLAHIPGGSPLPDPQPHDPAVLAALPRLALPIGGSPMTPRDFQLPGAPRHYRLGVHEGLDFYWQRGTQVTAVADGIVIRANTDYVQATPEEIWAWQQIIEAAGVSTDEALDFYRGRQVWIEHAGGLVSRYVHLDSIAAGIGVGTAVSAGQLIGTVGNSGSPSSPESPDADVHLHFELWLGDAYLGQYLRPIETREWLQRIFWSE